MGTTLPCLRIYLLNVFRKYHVSFIRDVRHCEKYSVEESFKKSQDHNAHADDFQNLISSYLSGDRPTSVLKFYPRSDQYFYMKLLTDMQTDKETQLVKHNFGGSKTSR